MSRRRDKLKGDASQPGETSGAEPAPALFTPWTIEAGSDGPAVRSANEAGPQLGLGDPELAAVLETLLFVSHEPLGVDRLMMALGGPSKAEVVQAVRWLKEEYEKQRRSLQVVEVAGGFQLVTRPEYGHWIKRLEKAKAAPKLSRSALESLAIIAYRQPIVRAEIEEIRGVETSSVLRTLLERKLIRIVGRKEMPGRPILYGTTKFFLQHFGLRDLAELPPLREFKELGEPEQTLFPVGDEPLTVGDNGSHSFSPKPA